MIRTLAYVVTECRQTAEGTFGRQTLQVRRGNCAPVIVAELAAPALVRDPFLPLGGLCRLYGENRGGYRSVLAGAFTRVGVSPDGSTVVFEATTAFSVLSTAFPLPFAEGIYRVGADGQGLERLAAPSRNWSGRLALDATAPAGLSISTYDVLYRFSPDGRTIAFTDRGPGPAGQDAIQIVTLDLATGERTLLTRLSAVTDPYPGEPVTSAPRFEANDSVVFFTYADLDGSHPDGGYFRVRTDGTRLEAISTPIAIPGSRIRPTFDVGGGGTNLLGVVLTGPPVNSPSGSSFTELFLVDGRNLLQLTNFRRTDTGFGGKVFDRRGRRGYFSASADPFGTNPSNNCQLFSIDALGTGLRQLTRFQEAERSISMCDHSSRPGCSIGPLFQDQVSRTIVFYSGCDPFRTGVHGGNLFAIRPDGTGLRQLTATRGLVREPGGALSVELPGPVAYSALDGGR